MLRFFLTVYFLFAWFFPLSGFAAEDWSFCAFPAITAPQKSNNIEQVTHIQADRLLTEKNRFLQFSGNVLVSRGTQQLSADFVEIDKSSNLLSANGQLSFSDQLFQLSAQSLTLNDENNTGIFDLANFQLYGNHLRGSANKIIQLDANRREFYDVSYTTCDPQQNTWSLDASKLQLNQQDGRGTALHTVFRIKDIPVFYFPWFQFPIDNRRMSGLLSPTLTHSEIDGIQLTLPFYWNQAENYDMTLTPVWYHNRGLQLNTENRYLFNNNSGQLNLSWLNDKISDSERWYRRWNHEADLPAEFHSSILIQKVSDSAFLEDFDRLDTVNDVDFLKSSVNFSGQIANWNTQLLFEQHQTVNEEKTIASSPYKRLPSLTLDRTFIPQTSALTINWANEWVRFDKQESITGDRLHISPIISYPYEDSYFFIRPQVQLDYTRYSLDNNIDDMNNLDRSIPLFSLDSGLIFERLAHSSKNWKQTLEPRLYMLYVPYEEQNDIPDFDTSLLTENYNSLFVNNRFSGADRIGDSQQISLGITTRLLDESNREFFSASIGQAYYAENRRVSLSSTIDEREKSSLMTLLKYKPGNHWDIQLSSVYDQVESESEQTDIAIRHNTANQVFNLEYHMRQDRLEQTTLSFVYPVSFNWTAFAKRHHSLIYDKPVQNLLGLAYESCCWGFKMLYEEKSDKDFKETDRAIYLQLTFKGLSNAGKDINSLLEDAILGYQPVF